MRGADNTTPRRRSAAFARRDALKGDDESRLVRSGRDDHERSSFAQQRLARGKPLDAVAPEVDEDLALQSVRLDDSPDFERDTLVGHG